jgi:DNA-directed RNA polymerase specialized sigma24 family protein
LVWINKAVEHHKEWIAFVHSFGEHFFAEDIVQETYINLIKWSSEDKLFTNGKINKGYMWLSLKNTFLQHVNKANKFKLVSIENLYEIENLNNIELLTAQDKLEVKILEEMNSWEWYDKMLFEIYRNDKLSMRKIATKTKISLSSIFSTIKSCKEKLNDNVGEDYTDYKNGDYELL